MCGTSASVRQWSSICFITALTLVSALALALVYGLGGFYALRGSLDSGAVVSLALLLTRLYAPLTSLAGARVEVMSALVSFQRVFEVLDLKPLIAEKPDAGRGAGRAGLRRVRRRPLRLSVRREGLPRLPGGGRHAGHPRRRRGPARHLLPRRTRPDGGAGRLLRRGQVDHRLTGAAAVRRGQRDRTCRRHRRTRSDRRLAARAPSAWSPRTATSSTTPSAPTCCCPNPRPTDEELWDALRRARLDGLVASLPDGLDTVVGERGYRLSGGERQRLTIARLLLAQPRVVILDEATAHLDSTSEAAVQEALGEALAGRTSVVIAHRLSTVRAADLILVIENGRIVERGTHEELLALGGRYEELHRTQFSEWPSVPEAAEAVETAATAQQPAPDAPFDESLPPSPGRSLGRSSPAGGARG